MSLAEIQNKRTPLAKFRLPEEFFLNYEECTLTKAIEKTNIYWHFSIYVIQYSGKLCTFAMEI